MANTYWITGLSGAGKSTIGNMLADNLRQKNRAVVILDGDDMREVMGRTSVHTREERTQLAFGYAKLGRLIASQGVDVIIPTISMFHEVHRWNRENLPGYIEVYLDVPLDELKRRDPKGLYQRASTGEAKDVAGIDCKVDVPKNPDIHIRWCEEMTEEEVFNKIIIMLSSKS